MNLRMAESQTVFTLNEPAQKTRKAFLNPWKLRLFFLNNLPSALFWGLKIKSADAQQCQVLLPFSWYSKNPFRSIYFAAQCGAAELSTGTLAILALAGKPALSMLVLDVTTTFTKKANGPTTFTCEDGQKVISTVNQVLETGVPQTITMTSTGRLADGTVVSKTELTWTFKKR